ncbi:unnamed protein product [Eruca vesicaria subsp. sativa]|uniref:NYN domain-containing protein n=1 Tax=Eruca vesicaria subsp. sativa TaxID=29727 RepID=A0ABC8JX96_ERUVS|nr:unnamed protein product [Eruca vesicaria subsp. sativa]
MGDKGVRVQFFSGKLTVAFWNLDDCPVPNNTDVKPIYDDIESALYLMGFVGVKEIVLHCEKVKYDFAALWSSGRLVYLPKEYSDGDHCNVAVISKKPSDELLRVLRCLKSRGHNALLIEPPDGLFSRSSLFDNAQLLGGGKPIHKALVTYEDQLEAKLDCGPHSFPNEEEVYSSRSTEMIDFSGNTIPSLVFLFLFLFRFLTSLISERAKHVIGQRTVVFWDAVDSPFPLCFSSSPDVIFKKISKTLIKKGFSRKISIWAYVDNDSELLARNKTWGSRIYFLPGGNSRRIRMLNDIMLLSRDSPPHEASLILVSGQFKGDPLYMTLLRDMDSIHYYLVLVTPREQPDDPNVWPGLLLDRAYLLRS